jgi:dihydropteroate synthase-like protein
LEPIGERWNGLLFLLVTGQLAKGLVQRYSRESSEDFEVFDLPIPVASLLTPRYIAYELGKRGLKDFEAILVPGMVKGDVSSVEEATGIRTYKGPRHAADLPTVLDAFGRVQLSRSIPACELLKEELQQKALKELEAVEVNHESLLRRAGNMTIGGLTIGRDFPMRVLAEIVDAPKRSDKEIMKEARYFVESGAHMVDVGMVAGKSQPGEAERAVEAVRKAVDVPISIDTIDPVEAESGVDAGAEMILSLDGGNVEEMARFASEVAVVVIPTNHRLSYFPKASSERVRALKQNIEDARRLGMKHVIADPILDPVSMPGIVESIVTYHEFGDRNPDIPLLSGVGNLTEMMHADTVGVNALAAGIASELGVSILLTTEVADHTRGCVGELATASKMMFLAKRRASVPKGLGIDMLKVKEKKVRELPYNLEMERSVKVLETESIVRHRVRDPRGYFRIMVDRVNEKMVALHYQRYRVEEPDVIVKGRSATDIYDKILEMGLVSLPEHVAYLGYELGKAEVALKTGRSYVQDSPLFD